MTKPLISVVIPCYGQARFLPDCIGSLRAQTMAHWEAIIVDDGSPDDTAEVARTLERLDHRVRLVRKVNGGLSSARNKGLDEAAGQWIQFLDADDLILPHKFETHLSVIGDLPGGFVTYTDYRYGAELSPAVPLNRFKLEPRFGHRREILDFASRWEFKFSIPIHAALLPRDALLRLEGPFDTTLPNHEDWDLWMRLCGVVQGWHFIDKELAVYRVSSSSMSLNRDRMWEGFSRAIAKQRRLQRHDVEVRRALAELAYANNYHYRKGWPGLLRTASERGWLRLVPWRLRLWIDPARRGTALTR